MSVFVFRYSVDDEMGIDWLNGSIWNETRLTDFYETWNSPYSLFIRTLVIGYFLVIAAIVALAIGGNVFVVWVVLAHERMRTTVNYFLVNVAIAEVMFVVLKTMFDSAVLVFYNRWIFGIPFCLFVVFIGPFATTAKAFTLIAMAVER